MRNNISSDETLVVSIISESFVDNPSVNSVVKNDSKRAKRLKELAQYAYRTSKSRKGVFISKDHSGVALCYRYNYKKESLSDYWNQLRLVFKCIGILNIVRVLKREAYIKRQRPANGDFLYFWFFGLLKESKSTKAAFELKKTVFIKSQDMGLPIYLETSVERNKKIYERYGFEVYHEWKFLEKGMTIWFMCRNVN